MSDVRGVILGGKYVTDCCGAPGSSMGHSWKCPVAYPSMNKELRLLEWLGMDSRDILRYLGADQEVQG